MTTFQLNGDVYEKLKLTVQLVLPAISTLYFALANIWDWSNAENVVGTIAAITVFGGALLKLSSRNYLADDSRFAGDIKYTVDETGKTVYSLELSGQPEDIILSDEVTFKVAQGDHLGDL